MKKKILIGIFMLGIICTILFVAGYAFYSSYRANQVSDIKLDTEGYTFLERHLFDFKLPEGAKIDKASKINSESTLVYAKILISTDKVEEFKKENLLPKPYQINETSLSVYKNVKKRIYWWDINESNGDYYITKSVGAGNFDLIFCKPENNFTSVYFCTY